MLRFIHTSDLHLGKRFGRMPEELRGRLIEARHGVLERLAALAQSYDATAVLVAGDFFDTETPSPATLRQALQAMAADPGIKWVLIPGNHDSLAADELWAQIEQRKPENVMLALSPEPVALAPEAVVLPAPCTTRRPGRDLTAWMSGVETAEDTIRVGLAHGAVQTFGEDGASEVIAPDRAELARLDYLALGDWHGQIRITDRAWYSGAPEPDRFKHNAPGGALVVTIEGPGAKPEVEAIETGSFYWETLNLRLMAGEDAAAQFEEALPVASRRRQTLLRVVAEGRAQLSDQAALQAAAMEAAPDFALMEFRDDALQLDYEVADLDAIDTGGALRNAAETLLAETQTDNLSPEDRAAARAALSRLYSYVMELS